MTKTEPIELEEELVALHRAVQGAIMIIRSELEQPPRNWHAVAPIEAILALVEQKLETLRAKMAD